MLYIINLLLFVILGNVSCISAVAEGMDSSAFKIQKKIAITQIVKHPSLDLIAQGILKELKENGYDEANITQDNAQGNMTIAVQMAQKIVSQKPDLVIAISTPSAQTMQKALQGTRIPLVFGAVTDPLGAKLIKNLEKPEGLITGTIDLPSAEDQVALMQKMIPRLKTVGLVYNPSEMNSVFQLTQFKKALTLKNLKFTEATAVKTSEVQSAASSLLDKVEAIFIPNDNTVVSALQALLKVTNESKIPVFVSDPESVSAGALAGIANHQEQVGRETGKIAIRILKGEVAGSIAVKIVKASKAYMNEEAKKKLGL
ncbi:MAG: ABC transporter substrate-binding protein [Caedimonas sp.]|nr:ABC transporter substrate-binding protein [Caedimonas sp.]